MKHRKMAFVFLLGCAIVAGDVPIRAATTQTIGPNDNWGLDRVDQRDGRDGTYTYSNDGTGVNIYVIGTGVRSTHQDFSGRATYVGDFCTGTLRSWSQELDTADGYYGHDTHVASYAAGVRSGIAKGARIYSLRTTWSSTDGVAVNGGPACDNGGQAGAVAAAVRWVTAKGQRPAVLNYSGGSGTADLQQAILSAIAAGLVVTLSGNTGKGTVSANWGTDVPTKALVVGSVDQNDRALANDDYGPLLALYAPGQGLVGAGKRSDSDYVIPETDGCSQRCRGGDSFAAPFVAGDAALYLQGHPTAMPAEVRAAIIGAATQNRLTNTGTAPNRLLRTF